MGYGPPPASAPDVVGSWQRCEPYAERIRTEPLPHRHIDMGSALRQSSRLPLRGLAEALEGLQAGLVVAEKDGTVVDAVHCSTRGRAALERIDMVPGVQFSEDVAGPNGIGTTLATGRPTSVTAADHLRPGLGAYSCVGVPLRNPRTSVLVGALEFTAVASTLSGADRLVTFALASARRRIEHALAAVPVNAGGVLAQLFEEKDATASSPLLGLGRGVELENAIFAVTLDARDRSAIRDVAASAMRGEIPGTKELRLPSGDSVALRVSVVQGEADDDRAALVEVRPLSERERTLKRHERSERRRIDRSRLGARHRKDAAVGLLHSSAPLWVRARADVVAALERKAPVLISGDSATGKTSLAAESFALLSKDEAVILDPADVARRVTTRGGLLGVYDAGVGLVLFRNLESLSETAVARIARIVAEHPDDVAVAATVNPRRLTAGRPAARLLPLFRYTVQVPTLADRREDLPGIVEKFLPVLAGNRRIGVTEEALDAFRAASWPGNLAQLRDVLEKAIARCDGRMIRVRDLPPLLGTRRVGVLESAEREAIVGALYRNGMNRSRAAVELGISRSSLYRKISAMGIELG